MLIKTEHQSKSLMKHPRGYCFVHVFHTFVWSYGLSSFSFDWFFLRDSFLFAKKKTRAVFLTLQMRMIMCGFLKTASRPEMCG